MTRTLGVGMIGYGFMGKMHTFSYAAMPFVYDPPAARVKLVGVCATSESTRAHAMEQAGYAFGTPDVEELVARPDIDVINVCTPNHLHREHTLAALRAGKHVYCDKPLAMNAAEASDMADLARRSGLTCQVTFQYRFVPAVLRAKQMMEDGYVGDVLSFRSVYLHSGYTDPSRPISWRMQFEKSGGGALLDLGSHAIDLVRYLIGDFSKVSGRLETFVKERPISRGSEEKVPVTVDDLAILNLETPSGAVGTIEASRVATGTLDDLRFEIHGTEGAISFNLMDPNWLMVYDDTRSGGGYGGDKGWQRLETVQNYPKPAGLPGGRCPVGWSRFHMASLHSFVDNVVNSRPGSPSFDDGLAVQRVMDAALLSSKSGSWQRV